MEPAGPGRVERRLAAILAADVAGYSRLIGADEEGTLGRLKALRAEVIDPKSPSIAAASSRPPAMGSWSSSPASSTRCAARPRCRRRWPRAIPALPPDHRIEFRIGINVGDVSSRTTTSSATASTSRPASKAWPSRAASASRLAFMRRMPRPARPRLRGHGRAGAQEHRPARPGIPRVATRPARASRRAFPHAERVERQRREAGEAPALPLPDKPSIAVLPFANMSGDPEQEYFADGMVEEIITALSRIRWLFVIARNSSFTYKGQAVDVKQVGRELGVRYVLEGSVRKAGNRVRITAQLIDAMTGAHLWADRFDGSLEDVFELQDKVAIERRRRHRADACRPPRSRRSAERPTTDLTAYDLYLRALRCSCPRQRERSSRRSALLEQAIARDPHYGPALAWAAFCCHRLRLDGRSDDPEADRRKGSISLGGRCRWPATTRASWRTPPTCWPISARTSTR